MTRTTMTSTTMTHPTSPMSLTHGAALAHIAELLADAERDRLAHALPRQRRGSDDPSRHTPALRERLARRTRRLHRTPKQAADPCAAC